MRQLIKKKKKAWVIYTGKHGEKSDKVRKQKTKHQKIYQDKET